MRYEEKEVSEEQEEEEERELMANRAEDLSDQLGLEEDEVRRRLKADRVGEEEEEQEEEEPWKEEDDNGRVRRPMTDSRLSPRPL